MTMKKKIIRSFCLLLSVFAIDFDVQHLLVYQNQHLQIFFFNELVFRIYFYWPNCPVTMSMEPVLSAIQLLLTFFKNAKSQKPLKLAKGQRYTSTIIFVTLNTEKPKMHYVYDFDRGLCNTAVYRCQQKVS